MDRCSLLITAKWPVPCWHEIQFILEHLWPTAVIKKVAFLYLHNVKILLWNGWVWSYKIGFMNDVDPHMIWFHQSMFLHLHHLHPLLWRFTYIWSKVLMISSYFGSYVCAQHFCFPVWFYLYRGLGLLSHFTKAGTLNKMTEFGNMLGIFFILLSEEKGKKKDFVSSLLWNLKKVFVNWN